MNIADLRRCAAKGMTIAETAASMGYDYSYTSVVARRHGIKFDRPVKQGVPMKKGAAHPKCKADPARIRELAAEGLSQSTIADFLGVSRERIRQIKEDGLRHLRIVPEVRAMRDSLETEPDAPSFRMRERGAA